MENEKYLDIFKNKLPWAEIFVRTNFHPYKPYFDEEDQYSELSLTYVPNTRNSRDKY